MTACSRGTGVGVEGDDIAAACLRVLTPVDMLWIFIGLESRRFYCWSRVFGMIGIGLLGVKEDS